MTAKSLFLLLTSVVILSGCALPHGVSRIPESGAKLSRCGLVIDAPNEGQWLCHDHSKVLQENRGPYDLTFIKPTSPAYRDFIVDLWFRKDAPSVLVEDMPAKLEAFLRSDHFNQLPRTIKNISVVRSTVGSVKVLAFTMTDVVAEGGNIGDQRDFEGYYFDSPSQPNESVIIYYLDWHSERAKVPSRPECCVYARAYMKSLIESNFSERRVLAKAKQMRPLTLTNRVTNDWCPHRIRTGHRGAAAFMLG